jgi:hypothetical protein
MPTATDRSIQPSDDDATEDDGEHGIQDDTHASVEG